MPAPVSVAQIHKFPFGLSCDTFSCVKPAKWQIGRPDGPLSVNHKLCDDCARDVLSNIPEELRPLLPQPAAAPAENGETLVCACGRPFEGVTAKATFTRHQKGCPAANGEAAADPSAKEAS